MTSPKLNRAHITADGIGDDSVPNKAEKEGSVLPNNPVVVNEVEPHLLKNNEEYLNLNYKVHPIQQIFNISGLNVVSSW